MGDKPASRVEMVEQLVEHALAMAGSDEQRYWLRSVFEKGFIGYSKLSNRQLRLEMQLHGLDQMMEMYEEAEEEEPDFHLPPEAELSEFARPSSC